MLCDAGHRTPRAHQSDPSADSRAVFLHQAPPWNRDGRDPALRMHLHPAVLHPQQHLVRSAWTVEASADIIIITTHKRCSGLGNVNRLLIFFFGLNAVLR